jgi:hypothetical protein
MNTTFNWLQNNLALMGVISTREMACTDNDSDRKIAQFKGDRLPRLTYRPVAVSCQNIIFNDIIFIFILFSFGIHFNIDGLQ